MKCVLFLAALFGLASAGYLPTYGHHGYGHGHGHYEHAVALPVVHKVPIATSYHHEHRTYHPVIPIVKHVPVVKHVAVPIHVPVVHHHAPHYHYGGHHHGYGHGFGHY